ncbi:MAG: M14 family metallopeptidase [Thermoanaerobaculia bacterium]|nr:M14 family metallopeptidase [Thermoanaerobaculia bacterium]
MLRSSCRSTLRTSFRLVIALGLLGILEPLGALAREPTPQDASPVPTVREVVGHDPGDRITVHAEMVSYLETLAEASPRVTLVRQGATWEGRELLAAVVTSPDHHARLDEIREEARRLGDPRTLTSTESDSLIEEHPAVVWLGGSIHGNELSGSEGLLKLLEHLATRDDPETRQVLEAAVILIDPVLNPDGRDAFAHFNRRRRADEPNPRRKHWGNDNTWWEGLGFRTGHYFFDTNRDWFAHTQLETRNRMQTLTTWHPQVVIDAHEMGSDVEFFFDPPTDPYGPEFPEFAREWFRRFGEAYARAFDTRGFEYMTGERYNYFYPGYTTSWGSFQGAVGMLYEQGSSRGLALTRPDDSVRTLADATEQQYTAAWTALRTVAEQRRDLLSDYHRALREAMGAEEDGIRAYYLGPGGDPGHLGELIALLMRNGVEVAVLDEAREIGDLVDRTGRPTTREDLPAGTYVVSLDQPRADLIQTLLAPDQPLPEEFLQEARARIDRGESPRFYDITAWSLPLLFDVEAHSSSESTPADARRLSEPPASDGTLPTERAGYAYLVDGRDARAVAFLHRLRREGHRVATLWKPTRLRGVDRDLASGTAVVRVGQNDESIHDSVRQAARDFGVELLAVDTGLAEPGFPSLGSGDASFPVRETDVAMLAENPIHGYSFGWSWYCLEEQYDVPVTVLRVDSLDSTPIHDFEALILPRILDREDLSRRLGEEGMDRLREFVREGGTLVALGSGVDFVREELELTALRDWYDEQERRESEGSSDRPKSEEKPRKEEKQGETEAPESSSSRESRESRDSSGSEPRRFDVPGAILRLELDEAAWLRAGYEDPPPALVTSDRILLPPEGPPDSGKRVVARYATEERLHLSGHVWPESAERLPGAVFVYEERIGRGRVIAFAEDPGFRGYWRGADRLFLNATLLGPSAP